MEAGVFLKGLVLGLSVAAPVGPIGVLCIRRTLAKGRLVGLATGLGAAAADGMYGAIAGFGLTAVTTLLTSHQSTLRLVGGAFLLYLGATTLLSRPADRAAEAEEQGLLGAFASTFLLTVTNPMTILTFMALFAGLGGGTSPASAGLLVLGTLVGSGLWWFLLSGGVSLLRDRLKPAHLVWINRGSGALLIGAAVFALGSLLS